MTILDRLFIGLLSFGFLCLLFTVFFIFSFFSNKRKTKQLEKRRRPKNKKKRIRLKKELRLLKKTQKKLLVWSVLVFLLSAGAIGGGVYARYYQLTNLTKEDSNTIVQSYFLTEEIQENFNQLENGGNTEKIQSVLRDRSALLVSYGNRNISIGMSEEGTKLLVKYTSMMRESGTNLYSASVAQLDNPELREGYKSDMEKLVKQQQKVFDYFKISESSIKKK
ncbi:hypothetical protein [Candidatus Enterococcus clewellii]|uniref:Uncharacterized protein n=1 Tax=Candidatus Enterococcus clewellii TaxID=1834193 RepID=A0A242K8H8_9ENTE|nr:hypothetical protein [Enterococcus sp. 9E7_DIV0242]OTP17474.1 hypothetical protein A5888_001612 [Enterococcus sp. 9E7_DIV0242]